MRSMCLGCHFDSKIGEEKHLPCGIFPNAELLPVPFLLILEKRMHSEDGWRRCRHSSGAPVYVPPDVSPALGTFGPPVPHCCGKDACWLAAVPSCRATSGATSSLIDLGKPPLGPSVSSSARMRVPVIALEVWLGALTRVGHAEGGGSVPPSPGSDPTLADTVDQSQFLRLNLHSEAGAQIRVVY